MNVSGASVITSILTGFIPKIFRNMISRPWPGPMSSGPMFFLGIYRARNVHDQSDLVYPDRNNWRILHIPIGFIFQT